MIIWAGPLTDGQDFHWKWKIPEDEEVSVIGAEWSGELITSGRRPSQKHKVLTLVWGPTPKELSASNRRPGISLRIDQRLENLSRGSEELTQEEIQVARFHYSLGLCFSNCSSQNQLVNWHLFYKTKESGASLVAQWLRVCLLMQGTQVRALVWEDPTCRGAAGPVSHSYWACASGACVPQQERPR